MLTPLKCWVKVALWAAVGFSTMGAFGVPLALPTLTRAAPIIFIGQLVRVDSHPLEFRLDGNAWRFPGRRLEFAVDRWLLGGEKEEKTLVLFQSERSASNIRRGDHVLWFLSGEDHLGARYPVGGKSGHFRILEGKDSDQVLSLNLNTLLWKEDESIWKSYHYCKRNKFRKALKQARFEDRRRWLRVTDSGYVRRPIPLEVALAIVHACLPVPKPVKGEQLP